MKTGNTSICSVARRLGRVASMEPGHEDREYDGRDGEAPGGDAASMEPGHEDREYCRKISLSCVSSSGLNGARS